MSPRSWLRNHDSRRARHGKRNLGRRRSQRGATDRLNVEPLEDRRLLAFLAPVSYPVGTNPQSLLAADFNNDNVQDLAVADFSDNKVSVLLGSPGAPGFQPALDSATGMYPQSLAVGDFNGDGVMDLATGHPYGDPYETGEINVLLGIEDADGNGTGAFAPPARLGFPGEYPPAASLAVGDFNGDGLLDLGAAANDYAGWPVGYYWYGSVRALLGHGDGRFSAPPPINITGRDGGMEPGVVATEVNGDSFDDLVTVSWNADGGTAVTLALGSSGGLSHSTYQVFSTPGPADLSVAAGDLDADADIDLVVADRLLHSVSVLLGDGAGAFTEVGSYATGSYPFSVMLGDFTGDGRVDVATGASVLYGGGDGTFSSPVSVPFANGVAADFNGDGWLDAAAIVYGGGSVSVVINDQSWSTPSPPPPSVRIDDVTVREGNTGTASAAFTVTLSQATGADVTVHYATADITATAGSDYVSALGTVTIPAGQTSKTFTIAVKGDRLPEPTETFAVNLSAPTNATIADGQAIGTIVDNEPRISISDVSKVEGRTGRTTTFTFVVTLSAAYDQSVTMSYRTVNGTATTGDSDYVAKTGTLTFAPGQTTKTITIQVKGDRKREANQTFYVELFGNSSNSLFTKNRGIGTILNDD
jgi:hypothetical protein